MTTLTPTPDELDAIEQNLADVCSCEPESGYEPCNFCKVLRAITALRARADRVVAAFVCTGRGVTILVDSADELRAAIAALGGDHAE